MKKRGFTLIELLAVIVVLAIIAVIATPMVLNTIEDARKGSAIESVNGIISAAETEYLSGMLSGTELNRYDFPEDSLNYKGTRPDSGTLIIDQNGNISITVKMNGYCIRKRFAENKPAAIDTDDCTIEDSELEILQYTKEYAIVNMVKNSGFEDNTETGLANWKIQASGGTITNENVDTGNYSLKFVATTEISGEGVYQLQTLQKDHVYYAMESIYTENSLTHGDEFDLYRKGGTITGYPEYGNIDLSKLTLQKWEKLSFTFTYTPEDYDYWFRSAFTTNEDVTFYIDSALLVDLTETFGAGNEPSLEWCNQYISWFDGSSTIYYK